MIEEYRAVKGYEGLYEVSNFGNVKSLERTDYLGRKVKERILKAGIGSNGYLLVILFYDGLRFTKYIHKLVSIVFLNHLPNGNKIVVDHIDNNRLNNRLDNLQLINQRENTSKDRKGGTSKHIGVHWVKPSKKWKAAISINGKTKYLGLYTNEIQASNAYQYELNKIQQHDRTI
jgi:hypothetical protein